MAEKPAPKTDDSYSEEETDRRMDATIRAMIGMRPKPHPSPSAVILLAEPFCRPPVLGIPFGRAILNQSVLDGGLSLAHAKMCLTGVSGSLASVVCSTFPSSVRKATGFCRACAAR